MLGNIRSLASASDVYRATGNVPPVDDVPNANHWLQDRHFPSVPSGGAGLPANMFATSRYDNDIMAMRSQTGLAPGTFNREIRPPLVPIQSRHQLLLATLAVGFAGLFVYSLFTKKPLLQ